jgi:hypothetical protein
MKLKLHSLVLFAAFFALNGCSRFFIVKDKYDSVKKVAIVQYSINPQFLMGTPNDPAAKTEVAAKNIEIFTKELGSGWQVTPIDEVVANPAYKSAGKPDEHFYGAKDMLFFTDEYGALSQATIPPEKAKDLATALGVDAVVCIAEQWSVQSSFFNGNTVNTYYVNMFDKDGQRIWGDAASGMASEQTFGVPPGGAIATEIPIWVKANSESFTKSVALWRDHFPK